MGRRKKEEKMLFISTSLKYLTGEKEYVKKEKYLKKNGAVTKVSSGKNYKKVDNPKPFKRIKGINC